MVTLNISLITKKTKKKKTEQSDHVQIMRVFTENFRKLASFDCKASDPPVAARIVYLERQLFNLWAITRNPRSCIFYLDRACLCEFRKVDLEANNAGSRLAWIVNDHRKHVNLTFPTLKTAALHLQFHSDSHLQALSVEGFTRSMFC